MRPTHRLPDPAFGQEIADYWLNRGISLYLRAQMLVALDLAAQGTVQVRISAPPRRPIHAKIYKGDTAAPLGSRNFSHAGLRGQIAANVRFAAAAAPAWFAGPRPLAARIWDLGAAYPAAFCALLTALFPRRPWPIFYPTGGSGGWLPRSRLCGWSPRPSPRASWPRPRLCGSLPRRAPGPIRALWVRYRSAPGLARGGGRHPAPGPPAALVDLAGISSPPSLPGAPVPPPPGVARAARSLPAVESPFCRQGAEQSSRGV